MGQGLLKRGERKVWGSVKKRGMLPALGVRERPTEKVALLWVLRRGTSVTEVWIKTGAGYVGGGDILV